MIELYNGDCRTFLSNYNGAQFDAVITDPPYASGGATLAERSASTSQKYTATKKACRSRTSWETRWMRGAGCT